MNMGTFTWLRPVGIRMVYGGRADVQGSREDGGVAGGPYCVQLLCAHGLTCQEAQDDLGLEYLASRVQVLSGFEITKDPELFLFLARVP